MFNKRVHLLVKTILILQFRLFVIEALGRLSGEVFLSRSNNRGENAHGTDRTGGCVDATAGVNILEKGKKLISCLLSRNQFTIPSIFRCSLQNSLLRTGDVSF